MNALVRIAEPVAQGTIDDFAEACDDHEWLHANGWISLQTAVDNLQHLAERWELIQEFGQDFIQRLIAYKHTIEPAELSPYEKDYIERIVARLEAADAVRPRPAEKPIEPHRPASSTIDAFFVVARSQPADYLARWLSERPQDLPHLHKLWIEKCSPTKM
jgi:hypothetical protein